ncbi:MAG: hypothetical protein CM15mP79_2450 [Methanobacteriota archaeon]|nr:MAG: hypothetical protein CM15mP79_2450 [Euryarchaeota archaeon]
MAPEYGATWVFPVDDRPQYMHLTGPEASTGRVEAYCRAQGLGTTR